MRVRARAWWGCCERAVGFRPKREPGRAKGPAVMRPITEIRITEHGDEAHESWLMIRANRVSGMARLFDSDVPHQHYVMVTIGRCTRKRDLNHDWLHPTETLLEMAMSLSQWGAFVSSFGTSGVPATLEFLQGPVSQAPADSRFAQSHEEVRTAGDKALENVQESYQRVMEAFEAGGKRALREALGSMGFALQNAPLNMEFAAKSLTEHVENVVTKARADIEGMVLAAVERGELTESITPFQLEQGDVDDA